MKSLKLYLLAVVSMLASLCSPAWAIRVGGVISERGAMKVHMINDLPTTITRGATPCSYRFQIARQAAF